MYNTIFKPNRQHDPKTVLENHFTLEEISQHFTVRKQEGNFEVYPNYGEFFKILDTIPHASQQYHEVIFEQRQKIKCDIDASFGKLIEFKVPEGMTEAPVTTPEAKFWHVVDVVCEAIKTAFFVSYGLEADKIIICASIGAVDGVPKYGVHAIIDRYYVNGSAQAQEFTRRLLEYVPNVYKQFVDAGVNKRTQNFRIVGCHKGDGRVKKIVRAIVSEGVDSNVAREDTLITYIAGCQELRDLTAAAPVRANTRLCGGDVAKVLDICAAAGITRDNRFNCVRGGMFLFTRLRPSHCALCERSHDSDNTVIVNVSPGPGDIIYVYQGCRKYKQERGGVGVRIGEFSSGVEGGIGAAGIGAAVADPPPERPVMSYAEREIAAAVVDPASLYPARTLFDDLPAGAKCVYDEPALRPFELARTLVVHAAMKMGKTKALRAFVDRYFASKLRRDIIRYVSFRQTFSGNVKEKFADFTLYSDVAGPLSQDRLIVQVESMHRLEVGIEPPDLLILDECESIFEQFDSGLLRSFNESFAKFQYLIKHSKHVICMDAGVSDRTYRVLAAIRGAEGLLYHACKYQNALGDKYWLTSDRGRWFAMLYTSLGKNERVAISISSLVEARAIEAGIRKKFPDKVVKLYSSETLQSEKREHFADVNKYWSQCDILMYTPTVSAGVSFELRHFDRCFGYFTDQSCPVETCMQMIGRIRDVATREYCVFLSATGASLPVDIEEIRTGVYQRRENLMKTFDETGLRVEYGAGGEVRYHASDYFTIWLENARVRNLSKNAFIRRFTHVMSRSGASMLHLDEDAFSRACGLTPDEVNTLIADHTAEKTACTEADCAEIAAARDIDDDEAEEVRTLLRSQADVPKLRMREYEKHLLRSHYHFTGVIDADFVRTYRDSKIRRAYRNLLRIKCDPDPQRAVAKIQEEERAVYIHTMQGEVSSQYSDITRRYVFDQHRYAIGLLQMCGWKHLEDRAFIHTVMLAETLRGRLRTYWDVIEAACREFQIRAPSRIDARVNHDNDAALVRTLTAPISKILNAMYGVRIATKQKDPDLWQLTTNDLFTTNPDRADKKPLLRMPEFIE